MITLLNHLHNSIEFLLSFRTILIFLGRDILFLIKVAIAIFFLFLRMAIFNICMFI